MRGVRLRIVRGGVGDGNKKEGRKRLAFFLGIALVLMGAKGALPADYFRVIWVDDGDTVYLNNQKHVRYIGIDAPEVKHDGKKGEPFGEAALRFNNNLVFGKIVSLVFDQETADRYGRWLAYVYLENGTWINKTMIEAGYAHLLYQPPNTRFWESLLFSQRTAMLAGKGIWANIKKEAATACIGNRSSRRFHSPGCAMVRKIRNTHRVLFPNPWEAYWEGFSPASDCLSP